jgi:hypothetical protein
MQTFSNRDQLDLRPVVEFALSRTAGPKREALEGLLQEQGAITLNTISRHNLQDVVGAHEIAYNHQRDNPETLVPKAAAPVVFSHADQAVVPTRAPHDPRVVTRDAAIVTNHKEVRKIPTLLPEQISLSDAEKAAALKAQALEGHPSDAS